MGNQEKKKKYNVNLPKTPFPMKASLATREPEKLKAWGEEGLEKKILEKHKNSSKKFLLHDGPPYANGHIHIGHALNKTMKDIIVKHRTMQGCNSYYVPGWDCHGLPIEHALLKELGKQKDEVDQVKFRKKARAYAQKYIKIQMEEFKRLGIFGDWENPYLTMNPGYQAAIAGAFFDLYDKGYIYRGEKPVYWSIGCETALAEAELEYNDKTSKAIFVTFPLVKDAGLALAKEIGQDEATSVSFMIWTTTPWTLPANVGVAIHPDLKYGAYLLNGKEICIFATVLESALVEKLKIESIECLKTWSGQELKDSIPSYQHPFVDRVGSVILADYVSGTDGTGIVHIAPGHGEDDYVFGHLQNNLPIVSPVDHKGQYTEDFNEELTLKGMNVFKANDPIMEYLDKHGFLKAVEDHQHSYPFCWRSKTPVIVRSTPQWFIRVDHEDLRKRTMNEIEDPKKTTWHPDWGKNRILSMIESRPDWCLSRQRLWGVPIPVAYNKETDEVYMTDEFKERVLELFNKESADSWFERPIEDFLPNDKEAAKNLRLETDILDVWFDSGVSHQAVLEKNHGLGFPCELYLEGSDQHRGWFQTSLITAMGLRNQSPFQHVLTHGFVVDGQGKKMSKSLGNVVSPQDVMKKYGADILRLWVSSCDTNNDIRMSPEILERMAEAYRKMRNTFRYLLGNMADFEPGSHRVPFDKMESIDQWVLSRLNEVAKEVTQCYEDFKFHRIYQVIYDFCISDLSSFYMDVLKDRLYCESQDDPRRRSAQSAMFIITKALCQLAAPILVFTSDEVWRSFNFGKETSVHESNWDDSLWSFYNEKSLKHWNTIRSIRLNTDMVIEQFRETKEIGSSLDCEVSLEAKTENIAEFLQTNQEDLELGLIVSKVVLDQEEANLTSDFDLEWADDQGNAQTSQLTARVRKAKGSKCARCWKYYPEVGTLEDPALCARCFGAEQKLTQTSAS